jgi:hypothetical protein
MGIPTEFIQDVVLSGFVSESDAAPTPVPAQKVQEIRPLEGRALVRLQGLCQQDGGVEAWVYVVASLLF